MDALLIVTFPGVTPIAHEHRAIWRRKQIDATEPWVCKKKRIGFGPADRAAAVRLQPFHIDAAAMKIEREQFAIPLSWPLAALINEQAAVGMPAAGRQGRLAHAFADIGPHLVGCPMHM